MPVDDIAALLQSVKTIAREAGEQIMAIYDTDFKVDVKADHSPLTEADLAAHQCIVAGLGQVSDFPIISEESAALPYTERRQWTTYWLVDPLDGTKEFIKRNGNFTVNIALIHEHKPILGVVYIPVKRQSYFAAESMGAFKQEGESDAISISVKPEITEKLIVAGSRSHSTPELESYLDNLPDHELMSIGSSLKFCLVAEGIVDIYPRMGLTSEWDTAAAQCVVEQAGGRVTETTGEDLRYNTKDSLLNPYFLVFGDVNHDWCSYIEPV